MQATKNQYKVKPPHNTHITAWQQFGQSLCTQDKLMSVIRHVRTAGRSSAAILLDKLKVSCLNPWSVCNKTTALTDFITDHSLGAD